MHNKPFIFQLNSLLTASVLKEITVLPSSFFMFPPLQLPQPSHAVTRATQPTGEPTAASSTSMMLSTSPATEVTSSVEALGLSAALMDSGAAPYLSAKVTNMSITTATGLSSCSSSQILPRLKCNRVTCCWVFFLFFFFQLPFHCLYVSKTR